MKAIRKSGWLVMAAALMMGFTACTNEDLEPGQDSGKKTYTLTVQATKGGDTRALSVDINPENGKLRLNATWEVDEQVTVYNVTRDEVLGGYLTAQSAGTSTTLSGSLTGTIEEGDALVLRFLSDDYESQDGTLTGSSNSIDKVCDCALAFVTVATVADGVITTTGTADFENQQAVVRFTLKDKADNNLKATSLRVIVGDEYDFTISGLTNVTYAANGEDGVVYVAIPAIDKDDVTLIATVGTDVYGFKQKRVNFEEGKFYNIPVFMEFDPKSTPLTFEAKTGAEATVTFTSEMSTAPTIEYSIDGGNTWNTYTSGITLSNRGAKVSFRGDNAAYAVQLSPAEKKASNFSCTNACNIYGNIMSLVSSTGYATANTLSETYTFYKLFDGNEYIYNHPSKTLVLPATTLTTSCYSYMFNRCYNLETAPELPATTLAIECYQGMFQSCSSLTTAPELSATALANSCYFDMFANCVDLETAPELPATTLATSCYEGMFTNCFSLTTAPDLPATTLVQRCYQNMFQGCTSLNSVKCLATNISASDCTFDWLSGVAATGTFTKAKSMTRWKTDDISGIPSGWTVVDNE